MDAGATVAPPSTVSSTAGAARSDVRARTRGAADPVPRLPARYEDLGAVARGSFGEIRRVRDTQLDRVLAMKLLHPAASALASVRRRFFTEILITAQLQHPGVVPVYDHGELHDGQLWYTMKEVRGTTLAVIFDELHAGSGPEGFGTTASGWTFRRVLDAFARIAQTVACAHTYGIVHRDLKPENLMAGELGEVLVMDWGLARRTRQPELEATGSAPVGLDELPTLDGLDGLEASDSGGLTRHGDILGTPAYMPPEQAGGAAELHGPASDVYALGAVLYHLLSGHHPYSGGALEVVRQILAGPPLPIEQRAAGGPPLPAELARACEAAMQREIADRCSAEALAAAVLAWLDGARKREEGLRVLAQARALEPEIERLRAGVARARAQAQTLLDALKPFDPVETKRPAWQLEDEAERLGLGAALVEARWLQTVHGALSVDGALPEAHAMLAQHYRAALVEAERAHREEDATRFEEMLRAHGRGRHAAFLRGEGALSLVTEPPGAEVELWRYTRSDRRLLPVRERALGTTPLRNVPVQRGSYLLLIKPPDRPEVRYPVLIERDGHWDGVAPGEPEPTPIALPGAGELGPDEVYVPAGWCWTGGDREASDSLPARRIWIEGFVLDRFAVTNRHYLTFLNDLVAQGRTEEALAACPRDPPSLSGVAERNAGKLVYARAADGGFLLAGEEFGRRWQPDWPVVLVDWHGASAYARWRAARTGKPWRLPSELEREKAARGADGRHFPWGNQADATFACVAESHAEVPMRVAVTAYPLDESPYGARGLAGNTRDWCLEVWRREGPKVQGERLVLAPADPGDLDFRAGRGGSWTSPLERSRSAMRFGNLPTDRREVTGIRLARSLGPGAVGPRGQS